MHDQNVLILGLGISGLAMARWCTRQGARVTVADTREAPPQLQALRERCPQAGFVGGPLDEALMQREAWTLVARSPGLSPDSLAAARAWAAQTGTPLVRGSRIAPLGFAATGILHRMALVENYDPVEV